MAASGCPGDTFANAVGNVCELCNTTCVGCVGGKDVCAGCVTGLYLWAGVCYADCPGARFEGVGGLCVGCDTKCTACDVSASNCTACVTSGAD